MKRRIHIILVLLLLGILTSCAKSANSYNPNEKTKVNEKSNIVNQVAIPTNNKEENNKETASQQIGKDIFSFIPEGWRVLQRVEGEPEKVEGDLNKDGIKDIAVVIEEINEPSNRALLIAFGNKDNTYAFSIKAENALLNSDEGGIWGDPLEGISIDHGSLLINFYGGSNWRWYSTYRFRFQDNDWYLIGATLGSYFTGNTTMDNADEEDYNLLTGEFITKKTDEKGNIKTIKGNRGKLKLLKLKDFIANSEEKQF